MSGYFGIIHRDSGVWRGFALMPRPDEAAGLIRLFRDELPRMPFMPGNEITLGEDFGLYDVAPEDIGTLGLLNAIVFRPPSREDQMIAATAIALLLNAPFFFIEGSADPDAYRCWLKMLPGPTADLAHDQFSEYCFEYFA